MWFALTANILILGFFKYYGFLLDTVNSFLTTDIPYRVLPLPIGISFYTFQAISYVIDIYRKDAEAAEEYFILCALYQYVPAVDRRSDRPLRGY